MDFFNKIANKLPKFGKSQRRPEVNPADFLQLLDILFTDNPESAHVCDIENRIAAYYEFMSRLTTDEVVNGDYAEAVQGFISHGCCNDIFGVEHSSARPFADSIAQLNIDGAPFLNVGAGDMLVEPLYIKQVNPNSKVHAVDPLISPELKDISIDGVTTELASFWCDERGLNWVDENTAAIAERFGAIEQGYNLENSGIVVGGPCTSVQDVALQCKEDHPFMVRICDCDATSLLTGEREYGASIAEDLNNLYPSFKIAQLPFKSPDSRNSEKSRRVLTNLILPECFELTTKYKSNKHKSNNIGIDPREFVN